ncbi:MAG: hypothetical protein M1561_05960 [Gammaproteobacteria bacterium]|nr:hypothetical protein [Gammaproteobacteria bacterium]
MLKKLANDKRTVILIRNQALFYGELKILVDVDNSGSEEIFLQNEL